MYEIELMCFSCGRISNVSMRPDIFLSTNCDTRAGTAGAFSFAIPHAKFWTSSSQAFPQSLTSKRYRDLHRSPSRTRINFAGFAKPKCRSAVFVPLMNDARGTHDNPSEGRTALLIVDHGSKRTRANATLELVTQELQKRTSIPVYFAHMELASPTIAEGMQSCVQSGAKHVVVVPFFLAPGRHVSSDIPQLTAEAARNFPDVSYEVRPPIGTHPGIIDLILDRAGLPSR